MGRRDAEVQDASRWVFNRVAEDYLRRPAYPAALVDRLAALAGGPGRRIADLGAGVGHLALPLAARGLRVAAVEPAEAMLRALSARLLNGAEVTPTHACAEETDLPAASFDLVLVADALHWLDPERAGAEVGRLLGPGGAVAVVEAVPSATPFMNALAEFLAKANPRAPPPPSGRRRQLLALARVGPPRAEQFLQEALLDPAGLAGLLRSLSHVGPALGPEPLAALLDQAQALATRHGGARWSRALTLTWARREAETRSPPPPPGAAPA